VVAGTSSAASKAFEGALRSFSLHSLDEDWRQ
jgi:hypothetical protein